MTRAASQKKWKAETFRSAAGWTYEFKGKKDGNPCLERGYVVKSGTNIVHIRVQYVGSAGETKLKPEVDILFKTVKFV